MNKEVRSGWSFTHAGAIRVACHLLRGAQIHYPGKRYRARIRKTRSRVNRDAQVWTVYMIVPD